MQRLIWKREYEIGVAHIDEAHKRLVMLCKTMFEAVTIHKDKAVMEKVLRALQLYTEQHFREEEAELTELFCPVVGRMKAAHHRLESQLAVIVEGFGVRSHEDTLADLMDWLEKSLLPHFTGTDMTAFLQIPQCRKENARRRVGL